MNLHDRERTGQDWTNLVLYRLLQVCVGVARCLLESDRRGRLPRRWLSDSVVRIREEKAKLVRERRKTRDEGAPVTGRYLYHFVYVYLCTTIGTTPARDLLSSVTRYIPVPNYIDVHFGYERVLQINYNLGL